jgi:hypothetical protein
MMCSDKVVPVFECAPSIDDHVLSSYLRALVSVVPIEPRGGKRLPRKKKKVFKNKLT